MLELHSLLAFLLPSIFCVGEGAAALEEQVIEVARVGPGKPRAAGGDPAEHARLVERMSQLLQPFILRWVC